MTHRLPRLGRRSGMTMHLLGPGCEGVAGRPVAFTIDDEGELHAPDTGFEMPGPATLLGYVVVTASGDTWLWARITPPTIVTKRSIATVVNIGAHVDFPIPAREQRQIEERLHR